MVCLYRSIFFLVFSTLRFASSVPRKKDRWKEGGWWARWAVSTEAETQPAGYERFRKRLSCRPRRLLPPGLARLDVFICNRPARRRGAGEVARWVVSTVAGTVSGK